MYGRLTQKFTWYDIRDLYELTGAAAILRSITTSRRPIRGDQARPPHDWAGADALGPPPLLLEEALKQVPATFDARAETVASTPMFRDAFKRHRCIVPASGYFEWLNRPDGKQPYFISAAKDASHLGSTSAFGRCCGNSLRRAVGRRVESAQRAC